jgi:hypothetical protein
LCESRVIVCVCGMSSSVSDQRNLQHLKYLLLELTNSCIITDSQSTGISIDLRLFRTST